MFLLHAFCILPAVFDLITLRKVDANIMYLQLVLCHAKFLKGHPHRVIMHVIKLVQVDKLDTTCIYIQYYTMNLASRGHP